MSGIMFSLTTYRTAGAIASVSFTSWAGVPINRALCTVVLFARNNILNYFFDLGAYLKNDSFVKTAQSDQCIDGLLYFPFRVRLIAQRPVCFKFIPGRLYLTRSFLCLCGRRPARLFTSGVTDLARVAQVDSHAHSRQIM